MFLKLLAFFTIFSGYIHSSEDNIGSLNPDQFLQQSNVHVEKVTEGFNEMCIAEFPREYLFVKVEKVTENTWPLWRHYI